MSNYPAGSMRGSGIYSDEYSSSEWCQECEDSVTVDVQVDDWGNVSWECPQCGEIEEYNAAERAAEDAAEAAADAARDDW